MEEKKYPQSREKSFHRIRRCVMEALYDFFKSFPYATMELRQLSEEFGIEPGDLNWNIVYLEKCGLVDLAKSYAQPPFVSPSAVITAGGIELIDLKFPQPLQENNEDDQP